MDGQWSNFFICNSSDSHDVGQERKNVLQQLQWLDRRLGASNKLCLNRTIQFYLNNMTNLHQ